MRGTLDGKHAIVMRLARTGTALEGAYFYVPSIDDLALRGTVAADGTAHLDESNGKLATGAFDGRVDAKSGAFDGTWTDAKKKRALPFHLDPVTTPAGGPATLVERRAKWTKKPTTKVDPATWSGEPKCSVDVAWPEVVGAIDPPAEAKLNTRLREAAIAGVGPCDAPFDATSAYKVHANDAGVLSVELSSSGFSYGAAHPMYGAVFVNVRVPSGAPIALHEVITPAGDAVIERSVLGALTDLDDDTKSTVKDALHGPDVDFAIDRDGLRVSVFNALPHAFKGAGSDAPPIPPATLAGVRVHPSPVDALWR